MKRKPRNKSGTIARPLKARSVHFLEELDSEIALREQRLEATLRKAEAVEALHDRMLAKAERDGGDVTLLKEQRRRLIAEVDLPALFASVDVAIERYQAVLAACEVANGTPFPEAIREGLARTMFPEGPSGAQGKALGRLAQALHAYFWIGPDDRRDRRVRACWARLEALHPAP
jgi:hypothetical protein